MIGSRQARKLNEEEEMRSEKSGSTSADLDKGKEKSLGITLLAQYSIDAVFETYLDLRENRDNRTETR